jgi:exodeoxyribonuclease III
MKILTYNVNGIRAALKKDFIGFLKRESADVVCIQETKAQEDQVETALFEELGYKHYWFSAVKKGYSGVAIFCKEKPNHIEFGCGHELFDAEGRVIRVDFENCSVVSAYFPSGTTGDIRQKIKYEFLDFFHDYTIELRKSIDNLVVCGDYNICHTEIDIHNPVSNKKSSGFLPEERAWMTSYFESGMIDTFRHMHSDEPHHYTWWSYRANARANNKGWRIDYIACSEQLRGKIAKAEILPNDKHSDHCASILELNL